MRILRIADIPNNRTGGMSRTMYCTGDALAAAGHRVEYLFTEQLPIAGPLKLRRFSVPLRLPGLIQRFARQGRHYDVVEIHEPLSAPYCFSRKVKKSLPPVVIFSYGLEESSRAAEIAYLEQKGLPVTIKKRYSPLTVVFQAMYGVRNSDQVICSNSQDIAHLLRAGVPRSRLTQHHSGVEAEFLAAGNVEATTTSSRSGILFLGSWLIRKGILDLVPAMSHVLLNHPTVRFTIAGCGVERQEILQSFSSELHSQIRVLPKVVGNQALIDLYLQHSIFVLPSYFEGQPLVIIEAASLGLAMVTTNVCGMADFIQHGKNGLLVPVGDVPALTQALDQLVQDSALARHLGESARLKTQAYTWTNAADKILKVYQQAV